MLLEQILALLRLQPESAIAHLVSLLKVAGLGQGLCDNELGIIICDLCFDPVHLLSFLFADEFTTLSVPGPLLRIDPHDRVLDRQGTEAAIVLEPHHWLLRQVIVQFAIVRERL